MDVNTRRYNSLVDDIKCFPVLTAIHQKNNRIRLSFECNAKD